MTLLEGDSDDTSRLCEEMYTRESEGRVVRDVFRLRHAAVKRCTAGECAAREVLGRSTPSPDSADRKLRTAIVDRGLKIGCSVKAGSSRKGVSAGSSRRVGVSKGWLGVETGEPIMRRGGRAERAAREEGEGGPTRGE